MAKNGHKVFWKEEPKKAEKHVKIKATPESSDALSPAWQFHKRDKDHAKWGWGKLSDTEFRELIHDSLCNFETMTWNEIFLAKGDKKQGNKHHNIPVEKCCKDAQKRLSELMMEDTDQVFSLRLTNKLRLFGIRDGRVLRFIWHDTDHTVYPLEN